ncbi:MAG: GNAT family N-acetyltransferase [Longimicrobiales bacterium]
MSGMSGTAPAHHDLRLRNATVTDLDPLVRLHVQTFNETHGPGPAVEVREQQWRKAFSEPDPEWFCIVAETSEGRLVGFAKGQPYTEEELGEFKGELNKIYVLREYQKRGLGRRLVCAVAQGLVTRGINSMLLFGDARSTSNGFYERMGAERLIAANGEFHGGYGWRDLEGLLKHRSD